MKRNVISECIQSLKDIRMQCDRVLDPNIRLRFDELILELENIDPQTGGGEEPAEAEQILNNLSKFVAILTNVADLVGRWKN